MVENSGVEHVFYIPLLVRRVKSDEDVLDCSRQVAADGSSHSEAISILPTAARCPTIRTSSSFSAKCPADDNATDDASSGNWNIHCNVASGAFHFCHRLDSSWYLVTEVLQGMVQEICRVKGQPFGDFISE